MFKQHPSLFCLNICYCRVLWSGTLFWKFSDSRSIEKHKKWQFIRASSTPWMSDLNSQNKISSSKSLAEHCIIVLYLTYFYRFIVAITENEKIYIMNSDQIYKEKKIHIKNGDKGHDFPQMERSSFVSIKILYTFFR